MIDGRTLRVLVIVGVLVAGLGGYVVFDLGSGPTTAVGSDQPTEGRAELRSFAVTNATCEDDETHTNVTDVPAANGRRIVLNATIPADTSSELDAELRRSEKGHYAVTVETPQVENGQSSCQGLLTYRAVLWIPTSTAYHVEVTHDGELAYEVDSSDSSSGVGGVSSGSS